MAAYAGIQRAEASSPQTPTAVILCVYRVGNCAWSSGIQLATVEAAGQGPRPLLLAPRERDTSCPQ
jgi:hypothetical protein